jgi:hypothetical protein
VNHSKVFSLHLKASPCEEDSFPQLKKDPSADHMQTFTFCHLNTKIISALCWGRPALRCLPQSSRGEPLAGREATAPSIIIEIREVQWREEMPPDGGVITPKDIQMQPFRFKS